MFLLRKVTGKKAWMEYLGFLVAVNINILGGQRIGGVRSGSGEGRRRGNTEGGETERWGRGNVGVTNGKVG